MEGSDEERDWRDEIRVAGNGKMVYRSSAEMAGSLRHFEQLLAGSVVSLAGSGVICAGDKKNVFRDLRSPNLDSLGPFRLLCSLTLDH